mgnify:CR=1 FL=1
MKLFSSRSSRTANNGGAKKLPAAAIAIILVVVMTIGGTVAWLVAQTKPIINTFSPVSSGIEIEENTEQNYKTDIMVKNTGEVDVYVRVSLVANYFDENDNITAGAKVPDFKLNTDNWFLGKDGYYYYKTPLPVGEVTNDLLASDSKMKLEEKMQVTVLAQSVQAIPTNVVTEAWKVVSVDNDGNLSAK